MSSIRKGSLVLAMIASLTGLTEAAIAGDVLHQSSTADASVSSDQVPGGTVQEKTIYGWNFSKLVERNPESPEGNTYLDTTFSDLNALLGFTGEGSIKLLGVKQIGSGALNIQFVHTPNQAWRYYHHVIANCDLSEDSCLQRVVDFRNEFVSSNRVAVVAQVIGYREGSEKFVVILTCRSAHVMDMVDVKITPWVVSDLVKHLPIANAEVPSVDDRLVGELRGRNHVIRVYRHGSVLNGTLTTNPIASRLGAFTGFQDFPKMLEAAVKGYCEKECQVIDRTSSTGRYTVIVKDE